MQFSEISKGTFNDVDNTLQMFVSITTALLAQGIDQWNYHYPDFETLHNDVEQGWNYVINRGGKVAASIVLNDIQDEQYKNVNWKNISNSVLVIHRLGVHPEFQGLGLGKKMCFFAEEIARVNSYNLIRLDAYSGNQVSNEFYRSLGYAQADGYCFFRNKSIPFNCYEKKID